MKTPRLTSVKEARTIRLFGHELDANENGLASLFEYENAGVISINEQGQLFWTGVDTAPEPYTAREIMEWIATMEEDPVEHMVHTGPIYQAVMFRALALHTKKAGPDGLETTPVVVRVCRQMGVTIREFANSAAATLASSCVDDSDVFQTVKEEIERANRRLVRN